SSGPANFRRHGGEDRVDVAAGLEAEGGTAVVKQVEFDVAAAPDELLVTLGVGPGSLVIAADELRIAVAESRADVAGKGKVGVPVARVVVVVEDAADAARLLAARQVEVLVAPLAIAVVIGDRVGGAG